MSGASNVLDPVEAASDGISRSKHLIASTLDDLSQHHSWLESYHREERRRAERLRRQEALHRLEQRRQRAARLLRRLAVNSVAATRATASFVAANGAAFAIWATPRARALTRSGLNQLSVSAAWSWQTTQLLAREGFQATATGFSWSVRTSDAIGIVFRRKLSAGFGVVSAEAAVLAAPGLKRAAIGWMRTRRGTRRLASVLERRLTVGWTEAALRARRILETRTPAGSKAARGNRALVVRRSTALVYFEPRRALCPIVWTGGGATGQGSAA